MNTKINRAQDQEPNPMADVSMVWNGIVLELVCDRCSARFAVVHEYGLVGVEFLLRATAGHAEVCTSL